MRPRWQDEAPALEQPALNARYGKIGISAVAAAVRYQSDPKNEAYAPRRPREQHEYEATD